jgi:hypothetical protein
MTDDAPIVCPPELVWIERIVPTANGALTAERRRAPIWGCHADASGRNPCVEISVGMSGRHTFALNDGHGDAGAKYWRIDFDDLAKLRDDAKGLGYYVRPQRPWWDRPQPRKVSKPAEVNPKQADLFGEDSNSCGATSV